MDGLSTSIFRELFARIASLGLDRDGAGRPRTPAGRRGRAADDHRGQPRQPALRATHGGSRGPGEEAASRRTQRLLAHEPRRSAAAPVPQGRPGRMRPTWRPRCAPPSPALTSAWSGVVYNAVDDHLSGPDQLHQRWALEDLRLLLPLLREAREARRVVIITADHGHLLEDGTTQCARWRAATAGGRAANAASPHELAVGGGRVVTGDGSNAVVCLWGERTRYAGRKNGYHGGLSPQEVTVPLSVIVPLGHQPRRLDSRPRRRSRSGGSCRPCRRRRGSRRCLPAAPAHASRRKPAAPEGAAGAVRTGGPAAGSRRVGAAPAADDWIGALLASPVYASQRQLAARVAPPDDRCGCCCRRSSERGGKLSRAALAQRLGWPEVRIGGLLSAARRLLNVDQAAVLTVDETAGTIELNSALLQQQFGCRARGTRDDQRRAARGHRERAAARHRAGQRPRCARRRHRAVRADARRGTRRRGRRPRRGFKAVRGEYGTGKTFFGRWLQERARARGFAADARCRSTRPRRRCTGWRPSTGGWSSAWPRRTRPAAPSAA